MENCAKKSMGREVEVESKELQTENIPSQWKFPLLGAFNHYSTVSFTGNASKVVIERAGEEYWLFGWRVELANAGSILSIVLFVILLLY
jgi:hypothetical protein